MAEGEGSTPVRRLPAGRLLLASACVAAAGAGVWWATSAARPTASSRGEDGPGGRGGTLAASGTAKPKARDGPPQDPFARPAGPLTAEEALEALNSRLEAFRVVALEDLLRRGVVADAETLALLEEMAAGPQGKERALAQAVLMKSEGSRRFLREIAEHAGASEFAEFYIDLAKTVDPATGPALVKAFAAIRERRAHPELSPIPGIEDAIAALAADPKAGAETISKAVKSADPKDEPAWLDIAAAVRPVPAGVASMMADRIRTASVDAAEAPYGFVLRNGMDLTAAPPELHASLALHLQSRDDPLRGASMRAIGRLSNVDPATIDRIVRAAKDGEQASFDALIALRGLGAQARPAVQAMIDLEPSLTETGKFLLAQALLAVGGDGVGAYAARRIPETNVSERGVWLQGAAALASAPDAHLAAPAVASLAKSDDEETAKAAIGALARIDPAAADERNVRSLDEALADPLPARRLAAVKAVASLASLPPGLAASLGSLATDPDAGVRSAAVEALAGAWKFGAAAKPLVPTVLALLRAEGDATAKVETRVGLLRTLGEAAPDDSGARAALRAAASAVTPDERAAGLWGLSKVAQPTAEERAAVSARSGDPIERVRTLARSVLALPAWR